VFCDVQGRYGNRLGVVLDGLSVPEPERPARTTKLGFSETVFVDDPRTGQVDIHTPGARLPFAGHPLVGTSWLLHHLGTPVDVLHPPAGPVPTWQDTRTWVSARAQWASGRRTQQYASPEEVNALPTPPPGDGWLYAWAWQDEAEGSVRARAFPRRDDVILEDEATGAAAIVLTAELGRGLHIVQGKGSHLMTRFRPEGIVDVGGVVVLEETRTL
jgi:predicted PhzF superfamily epimerase YddE/YHI9